MRPPLNRSALMFRAHLVAKRFRDVFPTYQQALIYALKTVWADHQARREVRQAYAHIVRRPLTAAQIADSQRATRRCGASFT
jgi:hypothetical protein